MTSIYRFHAAEGSQLLNALDPNDYEHIRGLEGAVRPTWTPKAVVILRRNRGRNLVPVDLPTLSASFDCANARAREALEAALSDCAVFLPLACAQEPFWLLYVTRVVDALDEARSEMRRIPSGLVIQIKKPVFFPDRLPTGGLFRVPQFWPEVYAMQDFVDRVHDAGLTGLAFKRVWYPDEGS